MYGIHRIEKRCRKDVYGIQLEANRTRSDYLKGREFPASDIDWLKTNENVFLIKCDNWNKEIRSRLDEYGLKERKNSVVLLDSIYTASAEFFQDKTKEEIIDYFCACLEFHKKTYGEHVINAVIHFDEVKNGNVHMHVASIPIVERKGVISLCARDLMGGREHYRKRQDEFYSQVSSLWGLERGEIKDYAEVRKHINKLEYEAQEATIKAEKAKAELNIRERVKNACASAEEIEIKKSVFGNKVTMSAADYERLQAQVSTSRDLDNSLASLEQMAKETKDALAIDERVIKAEREKAIAQAHCRQLEQSIAMQQEEIQKFNSYIAQLENWFAMVKMWLQEKRLFKEFINHMERDRVIVNEYEEEYDMEHEREIGFERG